MTRYLIAAMVVILATSACAQDPVADWTFDDDTGQWQGVGPAALLSVTADENIVREDANPVAEFSYTAEIGSMSGVMTPIDMPLVDAKTLSFWLRTSDPVIALVSISEADGSNYMTGFFSLPDRWQEVAIGLSEFALDDDSGDENGQLDPDQIDGLVIIDATAFLAEMASQVQFLEAPELGPRMLWLDDVSVDAEALPPRWETVDIDGARAIRFDSLESTPLQWMMLAGKNIELDYDDELVADGNFSLRVVYDLPAGKLLGLMSNPGPAPLEETTRLRLSVMTEKKITLLIGLKEDDESEYNVMVPVEPADDFTVVEFALADFALSDDSGDENGQLDIEQVSEFSIADVSFMAGEPAGYNTLWIDDILFIE